MNAEISGDKAANALTRFEEDVAIFNPDYVSVMLGMNDGGYQDFSREIFETYAKDMDEILTSSQTLGAQVIVISPTLFDQLQYRIQSRAPGFRFTRLNASKHDNATMAFFGAWLRERAREADAIYVNFQGPLNDLTKVLRREERPARKVSGRFVFFIPWSVSSPMIVNSLSVVIN